MSRYAPIFAKAIAEILGEDEGDVLDQITVPPRKAMGHLAFPCFDLAKTRGTTPPEAATHLEQSLSLPEDFGRVAVAGPYVNLFVNGETAARDIVSDVLSAGPCFGTSDAGGGEKVPVDFSSPNIAKPFGIHHLRSTVIGHALCRMLAARGYQPVGINHIGDWGTQFGQLLAIWEELGDEVRLQQEGISFLLDLYIEFNRRLEEDPEIQERARVKFQSLEGGDGECRRLWEEFRKVSLAEFDRVYAMLGIHFDEVQGESYYEELMPAVLEELESKGLLTESEDATVVDLEDDDLGTALLRKKDGSTLYLTRDLAAADYRYQTYTFPRCLYVVGVSQTHHFQQMKKILARMGRAWHGAVEHVPFGMMRFTDRKMSTRKGDIIYLEDVLNKAADLARETIAKGVEEKGRVAPDNLDEVSRQISIGAVVFNDLKNRRARDVVFDWDAVLSFEGETGPYLQYTAARIASILARYGKEYCGEIEWSLLSGEDETLLLLAIDGLPASLARAVDSSEPSYLADQLLKIASHFSTLYSRRDWKVLSDDETLTKARLSLAAATRQALCNGLGWLGIPIPDRM